MRVEVIISALISDSKKPEVTVIDRHELLSVSAKIFAGCEDITVKRAIECAAKLIHEISQLVEAAPI